MLYVTTRSNTDTFTAQRALRENRGEDGGLYLPFHMPRFFSEEMDALAEKSFGQTVAELLNLLFGTKLTGWDVDFSAGRYPVRLSPLGHRILVAETWHNPDWQYERLIQNLVRLISPDVSPAGNWVRIGVKIAVLFGIFGELKRSGIKTADISLVSGDFSGPISAWYARKWGLPIGNIIFCCNENNALWDLVCHGQMRTDNVSMKTNIPEADVSIPENLERLIFACGGAEEVAGYLDSCRRRKSYFPSEGILQKLRTGNFVSVVSSSRIDDTISGIYGTNRYFASPHTALAYGGLLDYRAKTGRTGYAVVLSEKSPMESCRAIAKALKMPEEAIRQCL